ncbi:hypothetical protein [Parelusimicrobium proximum]
MKKFFILILLALIMAGVIFYKLYNRGLERERTLHELARVTEPASK